MISFVVQPKKRGKAVSTVRNGQLAASKEATTIPTKPTHSPLLELRGKPSIKMSGHAFKDMVRDGRKPAAGEEWLEKKIRKLYGKKCPDYEPGCIVCQVWEILEAIQADSRGEL